MPQTPLYDARWIWLPLDGVVPNHYVNFRKAFALDAVPATAPLQIAVDSDFVLYVNGVEAARGQYSDYPQRKTYTAVDVAPLLRAGDNVLAVLAYFKGRDFATYRAGKPGLILALQYGAHRLVSDGSWSARQSPAFHSGDMPVLTVQLGYTVCCDARRDDAWIDPDYRENSEWAFAKDLASATSGYWQELLPRPVPQLRIDSPAPSRLVTQGHILRQSTEGSIAAIMAQDATQPGIWWEVFDFAENPLTLTSYQQRPPHVADMLVAPDDRWAVLTPPADGADGCFIILDMGREEAGFLTFRLRAPAGTILDIAHGEHLDDGRVRMHIGGRNFADRYICAEGENVFTLPFRRLGLRYLEVHFSRFDAPIYINYIGVLPTLLPVDEGAGGFHTSDPLANRAYAIGRRTLQLCMHEHYEDCPWREQALYAGDSRNQALFGYYAFGNYDFSAACFELLGRGMRDDGLLELTAPARVGLTIPSFSLLWITDLAEHWLYSGSSRLFDLFQPQIETMLARGLAHKHDTPSGLYRPQNLADTWHLYDWMDGLAGHADPQAADRLLDAAYNLHLHEALRNYAWMLETAGMGARAQQLTQQAQALGAAIIRNFWDDDQGAFATFIDQGQRRHYADMVQVMALAAGLAPEGAEPRLLHFLTEGSGYPLTFYTLLYQALALRDRGPDARAFMAETISRYWEPMLLAGATSFWETPRGGDDFTNAGSLCHGWSALPVYYYGAYVLGVRPLAPGFTRFAVSPYPDRFSHAGGRIPTPSGSIGVNWTRETEGLRVELTGPATLTPVVQPCEEAPITRATYNGARISIHD